MIKKGKFILNNEMLLDIACALLFLFLFLQYTEYSSIFIHYFIMGLSVFVWMAFLCAKVGIRELILIFVFAIIDFFQIIIFHSGSLQSLFLFLPLAIYFVKKEIIWKLPFFIVSAIIVFITMFSWVNSPNEYILFDSMSRNYVSVFAIYALSMINICYEKEGKDCPFVYFLIMWFMCLSAFGRGGILASSIMVILESAHKIFRRKMRKGKSKKIGDFILIGLAILFVLYVYFNFDWVSSTILRRFFGGETSAIGSNADRWYMISSYINICTTSFLDFIFGASSSEVALVGNNMHNSYIQLHSTFGIIGLLFLIVMSVRGFIYLIKNNKITSSILFLGVLIRSFTDWCFPGFTLEFILWYYMLLPLLGHQKTALMICPAVGKTRRESKYFSISYLSGKNLKGQENLDYVKNR